MLIYQYSNGLDGFLSAVFRAYEDRALPDLITDGQLSQPPLSSQLVVVRPDEAKALRVEKGIYARLGMSGLHQITYAYASADPEKNRKLFYWILSVFKHGGEVQKRYRDPNIMEFYDMTARVTLEINHALLHLTFCQNGNGLHCAELSPEHNILPFLIPHCVRKLREPFLISDCKRSLYGVFDGTEWKVLYSEQKTPLTLANSQEIFQRLWKEYYRAIAIAAHENKRLQDSYLPRRYRAFFSDFRT